MGQIFSMDNKFFQFMGKVADLMLLNILFLLCCLPIVTIGPSLTAMHYVAMKMAKNEESYITRSFFKSFRQNLKQGILINIIMLAAAVILFLDFRIVSGLGGTLNKVLTYLFMLLGFLYVMVFLYIYPLLAKFYNNTLAVFRNSLLMAIRHLPYTILMLVVSAAPIAVFFIPNIQIQSMLFLLVIILGGSLVSYINARFFNKIFAGYIPGENLPDAQEDSAS